MDSTQMLSSALSLPPTVSAYALLEQRMSAMDRREWMHTARVLGKADLYFLLRYVLSTREWKDTENPKLSAWAKPWLLARCREAQFLHRNRMDIWARGHFKSTIKTLGLIIQWLLNNPNETVGIFSVTKSVADEFVNQVRHEIESNELLKALYPDVLHQEPRRESTRWTIEKGFNVKHTMNFKDASVRGFGLLDTNFTGHRISKAVYDDAVNEANITTSDMIRRTVRQFELSLGTAMPGSVQTVTGTFYAYGDPYHEFADKGFHPRIHPCYEIIMEESTFDDDTGLPQKIVVDREKPVLFPLEYLQKVEKEMGPTTFATQMLCNPVEGSARNFSSDWLRYYETPPNKFLGAAFNKYIVVDPANEKKKDSSYTTMWVIALGVDGNYYVVDGVWDRIDMHERANKLFDLVARWHPYEVRYEKYGLQSDIQYLDYVMNHRNFRFNVTPVGGIVKKEDRVERLIPLFKDGKVFLPRSLIYTNTTGETVNLTKEFIRREYLHFPNTKFMDMLDAMARICEPEMSLAWPGNGFRHRSGIQRSAWAGAMNPEPEPRGWMAS